MALVPGVALLLAVALDRHGSVPRATARAVALTMVATLVAVVVQVARPEHRPEQAAIDYLQEHAAPGQTGVVAFGSPNILQAAGLTSPYPHLWSLPVRVLDPRLRQLSAVLDGPDRPDWLVVTGRSIATWGVDASRARPLVQRYYTVRATLDGFRVYSLKDAG